jgi:aromatic ring-cleaving dioxygenase
VRAWNATAMVQEWREQLAERINQRLVARGLEARVGPHPVLTGQGA